MRGLGARIFFATAAVIVVVLGGALLLTKRRADLAADASLSRALTAAQSAVADELASRSQTLLQVTAGLARVPTYVAQLSKASGSAQADLLDRAQEFRNQTGAAWTLITDNARRCSAPGPCIAISKERTSRRAPWSAWRWRGRPRRRRLDRARRFGRPAVPVRRVCRSRIRQGNAIYGVLVAALPIDSAFAAELRRHTASEIAFFVRDSTGAPHVTLATLPRAAARARDRRLAARQRLCRFDGSHRPAPVRGWRALGRCRRPASHRRWPGRRRLRGPPLTRGRAGTLHRAAADPGLELRGRPAARARERAGDRPPGDSAGPPAGRA